MWTLVSGAAGKTGRAICAALAARGVAVRAFVRRPTEIAGAADYRYGDMTDAAAWDTALHGVARVYHICPNMHPAEVAVGRLALAAAQTAGVQHFVYHSVLHPQTAPMPHHWNKLQVEALLFASGLPYTIVQPTAYMQNLARQLAAAAATGTFVQPYPPQTALSLIDLDDLGAAVATILTSADHLYATYELAGTLPLSQTAVAELLSEVLGRPITVGEQPLTDWEAGARAGGLDDYAVATLLAMFRYYAAHGLTGNPNVLTWLLGRAPKTLAAWIREYTSFPETSFPETSEFPGNSGN